MNVKVRRQPESASGSFGVYVDGQLKEGGFFTRDAAEECARILIEENEEAIRRLDARDNATLRADGLPEIR